MQTTASEKTTIGWNGGSRPNEHRWAFAAGQRSASRHKLATDSIETRSALYGAIFTKLASALIRDVEAVSMITSKRSSTRTRVAPSN